MKDRDKTMEAAHDISVAMMEVFHERAEKFDPGNVQAQIFLSGAILGILNATLYLGMDGYSKIYGLDKFNGDMFKGWVNEIEKEIIQQNKDKLDGFTSLVN